MKTRLRFGRQENLPLPGSEYCNDPAFRAMCQACDPYRASEAGTSISALPARLCSSLTSCPVLNALAAGADTSTAPPEDPDDRQLYLWEYDECH